LRAAQKIVTGRTKSVAPAALHSGLTESAARFVEWSAMFVEPLFLALAGFATVAFVSAAFLSFIRNDSSALFFTLAAGATSSLFFLSLPRSPVELVLICAVTGIADVACATSRRSRG
jgi:hypothetical protein